MNLRAFLVVTSLIKQLRFLLHHEDYEAIKSTMEDYAQMLDRALDEKPEV